jgi:hypothetical protein
MNDETENDKLDKVLIERVNVRLRLWRYSWNFFLYIHFLLGTTAVLCSALAAASDTHKAWASIAAAVCVAVIGFLRPETMYHNSVKGWRKLEYAKNRYVFGIDTSKEKLVSELARCEAIVTSDGKDESEESANK